MHKKPALIVLALILASFVWAGVPPRAVPRILYAQTPVADLDRALQFYTLLGLRRAQDFPGASILSFDDNGPGTKLVLLHGPNFASYKSPIDYPAVVFELPDLPAVARRLAAAGFNVPEPRGFGGTPAVGTAAAQPRAGRLHYSVSSVSIATDPDGHPVELLGHLAIPGEAPFLPRVLFTKTATADIALAVVFYTALGLETAIDYPGEGRRFNMLFPGSEHDTRARFIINHGPRYAAYKAPDDVSRTVFVVPDIHATLARLAEVGFQAMQPLSIGTQGAERGHQMAFVKDHDGNVVQIIQ
jgi:catechol 2,3-dioxygenase-like lactoylglutathione lyase family enzyme